MTETDDEETDRCNTRILSYNSPGLLSAAMCAPSTVKHHFLQLRELARVEV